MADPVGTPLRHGSTGPDVTDLQVRLGRVGHDVGAVSGVFDETTEAQLGAFQQHRGLEPSGVCDGPTWAALVEASWRLGDRHLYLHAPMMRGDDVAALQLALGRLGFDAGRVDGIYGSLTHAAVLEFQRNSGLVTDGIVGPDTVDALARIGGRAGAEPVVSVRERERLRDVSGPLTDRLIMVGDLGGAGTLTAHLARLLRERGARGITVEQQDPSAQARRANEANAMAYVGVHVAPSPDLLIAHFATTGFESQGGRRLGDEFARTMADAGLGTPARVGLRLPVLRETRMPAVYVKVGPAAAVVRHTPTLALSLTDALERWLLAPVEGDTQVYPQAVENDGSAS